MSEFSEKQKHDIIYILLDQESRKGTVAIRIPYWEIDHPSLESLPDIDDYSAIKQLVIPIEEVKPIREAIEKGFITSVRDIKAYLDSKNKGDE